MPAWWLRTALKTRITTQSLHYRSGDEETAARSIYSLIETTRDLLKASPRAAAFEQSALFLLNDLLRPYTARWHRWIVDGRIRGEGPRRRLRTELRRLQPRLREFLSLLELLSDPNNQTSAQETYASLRAETPLPSRDADLGGPITPGIGRSVGFSEGDLPWHPEGAEDRLAGVDDVNEAEWRHISKRRFAAAGCQQPRSNATGLTLSGGGIRSATFCLGIVQVLARRKLLSAFDYLSTVSGGGYLGAFLTSYLGAKEGGSGSESGAERIARAFESQDGRESAAVRHLRNNSRYLLNGGIWGRLRALGLVLSGVLTSLLLIVPLPLIAVLVVAALGRWHFWGPDWPSPHQASPGDRYVGAASSLAGRAFLVLAASTGVVWLVLAAVQKATSSSRPESWPARLRAGFESFTIALAVATLLAGMLLAMPAVLGEPTMPWRFADEGGPGAATISVALAAPVAFALLAAGLGAGRLRHVVAALLAVSGPAFCLVVFLVAGHGVLGRDSRLVWFAAAVAALCVWSWCLVDVNAFSPHRYYRDRLCECYLAVPGRVDDSGVLRRIFQWAFQGSSGKRVAAKTGVGTRRRQPLSTMNESGAAPYHLVNATVNLASSREPNLRGRDADFYVFSKEYCGGPVCGYVQTKTLEAIDPHLDLGTAMAVSGAAASTNMGVKTMRKLRFLLALLNVRLGYWLRNPRRGRRRFWNAPGPMYLLYETTGWMHENRPYLNASDGGHIENLALYELLRRRCKFIVCVDGGMEPGMECADLMLAQRYAEIDLGARIEIDVADMALDERRQTRAYAVLGKVRYAAEPDGRGQDLGWLVYVKLACTGEEPGYVLDYCRENPAFPHQTTRDQIYDEAQFEAYRRLGECAAESLFREELLGGTDVSTMEEWFQVLADNLLPDNDPAFERPAPAAVQ